MTRIVAYLSHSYHPEDRAINMAIWRKLNALGVTFAVDPPSPDRPMDVTFLERMMQRSHCFVAIVPDRSRAPDAASSSLTWSAYQEFECRLAIRANKPRLIVVEKGIELGPLSARQSTSWFISPTELDPDLDDNMRRFIEEAIGRARESAVLPKMGILRWTPADARWQRVSAEFGHRVGREVAEFIDVDENTNDHDLLNEARNHTLVVADIHPAITPPHVLGLLHGAAIPTFRTCLLEPDQTEEILERELRLTRDPGGAITTNGAGSGALPTRLGLPLLFRGYRVDRRMRPIHFWRESAIEDTVETMARITKEYRTRERTLETQESADDYFLKLRGNRVFISTSSELAAWTVPLKSALETAGMPTFHYKVREIPVGAEWMPELRRRITEADMFMAFVSPGYWESAVCIEELALAIERWEQHQLIVIVGTPAGNPPLPAFLGRYQTEALSDVQRDIPDIVKHIQARFRRLGRSDESSVQFIAKLLARHLEAERTDVAGFLARVAQTSAEDALTIARSVGGDWSKLVEALVHRSRTEKLGGAALGRVCLWLRSREADAKQRQALTRQISSLRLFPRLHDIRAWRERRTRRDVEVRIRRDAPRQSLNVITALAGEHAHRLDAVRSTGEEIAGFLQFPDQATVALDDTCGVTVVSSVDDLMVPVEWAVVPNQNGPLARVCALSRLVSNGRSRQSIEELFEDDTAAPLRVLLLGYGSPTLPHVRKEIAALRELFTRRYAENGWPIELVDTIVDGDATPDGWRLKIANSDYDIVHIAGHAGWEADGPVLEAAGVGNAPARVASRDLGQWLQGSSARFVYLSCCGGASVPLGQQQFAGWRQTLCSDVLAAGVAEVAGYFWPVSDQRASRFALQFYESFLQTFDAPKAMLQARRSVPADDPTWAGSVIVRASGRAGRG